LEEESERAGLISLMEHRFGIPASNFEDSLLFRHQQSWWLFKKSPSIPIPGALKIEMVGLKAFQKVGAYIKPTTRLIQVFGRNAKKSNWKLTEKELKALVKEGVIDVPALGMEDGYVILWFEEYVLGMGLLIRGRLKSQIPRKDLPFYLKSDCMHEI
jgi:NOL1/NOP2/fmu family ribosome biogenesis protein